MIFYPSKDSVECSFLSAINDVWNSVDLWQIGLSVSYYPSPLLSVSPPSLSLIHTHIHSSTDTLISRQTTHFPLHAHYTTCTKTRTRAAASASPGTRLTLYLSSSPTMIYLFFSRGLARIVCSFNASPPDRRDLNSLPTCANKGARILL